MVCHIATATHIGKVRTENQDFFGVDQTPHGRLLIVCDGMGGRQGGQYASRLAVQVFTDSVRSGSGTDAPAPVLMRDAVIETNRQVRAQGLSRPELSGMGTTLVAALVQDNRAIVVNVGDSRAYRCGNTGLRRLTYDHSLVNQMVDEGQITEDQAHGHPLSNVITRSIGIHQDVEPDVFDITLNPGEQLLLCTDGLHGMVTDDQMQNIMLSAAAPDALCDLLIGAALDAGGKDNVTVVLARLSAPDEPGLATLNPPTVALPATPRHDNPTRTLQRKLPLLAVVVLILGTLVWIVFGDSVRNSIASRMDSATSATIRLHMPALDSMIQAKRDSVVKHDSALHNRPNRLNSSVKTTHSDTLAGGKR